MDKIKVALCLSGEPRSTMASFPYIYESFLIPNSVYKTDVYLHAWDGFRALNLYSPKKYNIERINELSLFNNLLSSLVLKDSFKKLLRYFDTFTQHSSQIKNMFLMFWSFKQSFDLITDPYDIYIKCRYDSFFEHPFHINNIIIDILDDQYDMFIPYLNSNFKFNNNFNDQIAIGNHKSFLAYSSIIEDLQSLVNQIENFDPHKILETQLQNHNLRIFRDYIKSKIIRKVNLITNDENFEFKNE